MSVKNTKDFFPGATVFNLTSASIPNHDLKGRCPASILAPCLNSPPLHPQASLVLSILNPDSHQENSYLKRTQWQKPSFPHLNMCYVIILPELPSTMDVTAESACMSDSCLCRPCNCWLLFAHNMPLSSKTAASAELRSSAIMELSEKMHNTQR